MSLYYRGTEIREIDDALYAAWVASNNPKAHNWTLLPPPPAYDPTTHDVSWNGTQWITALIPLRAVSKYQLRVALREQGRLQAFNTYITSLADGTFVREKWESGSGMFGFNKPWCDAVKAGLGLTAAQMRALWRSAQAVNEDE